MPRGALEGYPEVAPVTRDRAKDQMASYRAGTFFWHLDGANSLVPNKTTLLTAKEISDDGGDTEFANTYAAYDALPDDEKADLADVRVVHSFAASQLLVCPEPTPEQRASWDAVPSREHPLVWRRRDGRRSLLVGATAGEVVGRTAEEGRALLDRLLAWTTQPQFVVRHHWRRGDLVVWDNTGLLHRALPVRIRLTPPHASHDHRRPRGDRVSTTRTAIVTGGGSGIGRAIAIRLADDGMAVAVLDLNEEAAEQVADELRDKGHTAMAVGGVDVSDRAQVNDAVERVRGELGPALVLVNSAGVTGFHEFLKISDDRWDRILAVNLSGPFYFCQAVVPDMIEAGWGRIVNISSSSAQSGQQYMVHYVSSKAGLIGFTKSLALELGPKGITVNTIPPGFIDTPMLRASEERGLLGGSVEHHADLTPVRRAGLPEDIAYACSFLVSEEASYITGQVIGVNGGRNT